MSKLIFSFLLFFTALIQASTPQQIGIKNQAEKILIPRGVDPEEWSLYKRIQTNDLILGDKERIAKIENDPRYKKAIESAKHIWELLGINSEENTPSRKSILKSSTRQSQPPKKAKKVTFGYKMMYY
ncbi:MAG: hypothetical protein ACXWL5_04965 [Candidatus Chromulinivorax sp.]